jgi:uncharacterized integral membrane protein
MATFATQLRSSAGETRLWREEAFPAAGRRVHGLGLWWTITAALVAAGAVIVAIVQNGRHVRVHYLAWHIDVSLIVVVLATALAAILLDQAGGLVWRHRQRARLSRRSEFEQLRTHNQRPDEP